MANALARKLSAIATTCVALATSPALAQSSCSASNEVGGTCSITCPVGQAAVCIPANGASTPECFCTGGSESQLSRSLFTTTARISSSGALSALAANQPVTLVDVKSTADAIVAAYGPVPVTRETVRHEDREFCRFVRAISEVVCTSLSVPVTEKRTTNELLTFGPLEIVDTSEIAFDAPSFKELPDEVTIALARAQNCQDAGLASVSNNVGVTVSRGSSLSITSSVTRTVGKTLGFSYKVPDSGFTINGQLSVSNATSSGSTKMEQESTSIARSTTATVSNLKPNTAVAIEVYAYKIGVTAPFSAKLVVDAALSANDRGLKRLSDIAAPDKRTFYIRGVLNTNNASQANVVYYEAPFSKAACRGGSTSFEPVYMPARGQRLNELKQSVAERSIR